MSDYISNPEVTAMKRSIDVREDELAEIEKKWPLRAFDMFGYVRRWDEMGEAIGTAPVPVDEAFLEAIDGVCGSEGPGRVMEIGCGTGDHCFALAGRAESVLGLDISPVLVGNCRRRRDDAGIGNVEFEVMDWFRVGMDDPLVRKGADTVIAHYSPAVYSYQTFRTMIEAAKRAGVVCLELNWSNPLYMEAYRIAEIPPAGSCEIPLRMVDVLWHLGLSPRIGYVDREARRKVDPSAAAMELSSHMEMFEGYDHVHDADLRELAESFAEDGTVEFLDRWTDVCIGWEA